MIFLLPEVMAQRAPVIVDTTIFISICGLVGAYYMLTETYITTIKAKAWLVTFLSSGILSIIGVFYVIQALWFELYTVEYIFSEDPFSRRVMIFFMATNVMDLALGVVCYPKYLDPLSTIAHHSFYILFTLMILTYHYSNGFMLTFVMEIPTAILSAGTIWNERRSDVAFGVTFLLTRIMYNIFLSAKLAEISFEGYIWKVSIAVLCLHLYWFRKWVTVYGKVLFGVAPAAVDKKQHNTLMTEEDVRCQTLNVDSIVDIVK